MRGALLVLVLTHLAAPAVLAALLAGWRVPSRLHAMLLATLTATYVAWIGLAGRWDWFGYGLRYLWPLAAGAAAAVAARRLGGLPWLARGWQAWRSAGLLFAFIVPVAAAAVGAVRGRASPAAALPLAFPLPAGAYYVAHGGSTRHLNYHHAFAAQRYALDLTALRFPGRRAAGVSPDRLESYHIFGREVRSPCAGAVVAVEDGRPDQPAGAVDRDHPAGNHVVLRCGAAQVLLAHLRQGTLRVQPGDEIAAGDLLAQVGNSGHTTEPHLHLHAVGSSAGLGNSESIPIAFNGRFPVRNHIVVADSRSVTKTWRW